MYSDNLDFSPEGLQAQIGVLEEVLSVIKNLKNDFVAYTEFNLHSHWISSGSSRARSKLRDFIYTDIDGFIQYLTNRIEDLRSVHSNLLKIDEA